MNKVNILIPVHKYNDEIGGLLKNAIESVSKQEKIDTLPNVFIISPTLIKNEILGFIENNKKDNLNLIFIENDGESDFQSQINFGVKSIESEYFSILEFDDEYSTTYFNNVKKHVDTYPEIEIFLSMMIEVNDKNQALKLTNETVWAQQFVGENGEMGYLNTNSLKQVTDFKISGSVIKREDFINIGGLKKNIKLTFNYEFLLRSLNNAFKIYVIPKIGYKHFSMRNDSLFDSYQKELSINERKFWFDTAIKECNFMNDRFIDVSQLSKK
jgi:hypothetical protein